MEYNKTVLFVDDQREILNLLERMLKDEKYNKIFTNSVDEARTVIKEKKIDVLVTDLIMPEISGITLLEEVKNNYPQIVRIVLSGHSQIPSILSAINKGDIWRYITKPWKVNQEAKDIIKEAIDYSDFLNIKKECLVARDIISIDTLTDILKMKNIEYYISNKEGSETEKNLKEELGDFFKKELNAIYDIYIKK